ncbi:MAG: conserved membrane protein of unknown function [Promethearchaeota archaeon]|nr:MAG: conserved membrane protein of unknown function [Candidatus Lokiarchaeota archaeon]
MKIGIESLNQFEIVRGTFTLAFVIISIMIGIRILLKYFSLKEKAFITVGLTWIFISSPWWGNAFSFLSILLFRYAFDAFLYLLLMNAFVPVALMTWVFSLTELTYPHLKYKLITPYYIICVSYLVYFIIALSLDTTLIANQKGIFDFSRTLIPTLFAFFALINVVILGILFANKALKSPDPRVQWKGKFFFIGIFSFVGATLIDTIFVGEYFLLRIIVRLILIMSGVFYYLGFFLSDKLVNRLIKETTTT